MIRLSLSSQYFYTIRSVAMFLKVLNKVNAKVVMQTEIISYYWLTPVRKFLELLAINHISSEMRIIFVPLLLKFYHVLVVLYLHGCTLPHSWLIELAWSGLAPIPGYQGSCCIVPNGPTGLFNSFNIRQGLKCKHVASTSTLTMWLLCSNCSLLWTTKCGSQS